MKVPGGLATTALGSSSLGSALHGPKNKAEDGAGPSHKRGREAKPSCPGPQEAPIPPLPCSLEEPSGALLRHGRVQALEHFRGAGAHCADGKTSVRGGEETWEGPPIETPHFHETGRSGKRGGRKEAGRERPLQSWSR